MTHHPNTPASRNEATSLSDRYLSREITWNEYQALSEEEKNASRAEQAAPSVASGVEVDQREAFLDHWVKDVPVEYRAAARERADKDLLLDLGRGPLRIAADAWQAGYALAAPGAAIAAREQEAHPEHARALAEHILSMDLATEKGKHARYLARKVLAKENESPAELALRSLASWLGCGGYNATAIDAGVMERRIRDAIAPRQEAPAASAQPMFFASPEQANALQDRPGDAEGGVYLPLRKTVAGKFTMPLYATPTAARSPATVAQPVEWVAFADREPPETAAKDDATVRTTDRVLVTNNLNARDRMGRMSHVWFASPIKDADGWSAFDDRDREIIGLTHWFNPFAQPCPTQGCGGDGGSQE